MLPAIQPIIENLIKARKERRLTQDALAKLLRVPQSYIARYESGNSDIRLSRLIEIARVLDSEVVLVPRNKLDTVDWALDDEDNGDLEARPAYVPDEDDEPKGKTFRYE